MDDKSETGPPLTSLEMEIVRKKLTRYAFVVLVSRGVSKVEAQTLAEEFVSQAIFKTSEGTRNGRLEGAVRSLIHNELKKRAKERAMKQRFSHHLEVETQRQSNASPQAVAVEKNKQVCELFEAIKREDERLSDDLLKIIKFALVEGANTNREVAERSGLSRNRVRIVLDRVTAIRRELMHKETL